MNKIINYTLKLSLITLFIFLIFISYKSYNTDNNLIYVGNLFAKDPSGFMPINKSKHNTFLFLVDYSSNSYFAWGFYKQIFNFCSFLTNEFNLNFNNLIYISHLVLFFIFLTFLIRYLNKELNYFTSSFCSLNFILLITYLFSNKTYVISSMTFLPLFILCLLSLYNNTRRYNILLKISFFLLVGVLLVKSANNISFLYIVFSSILVLCINSDNSKKDILKNIPLILISIYSLYYTIFNIPPFPKFDYPWYGSVVEDDGLSGNIRPLLNESSQIPFVDEVSERALYRPFVLFLCVYIIFVIYKHLKSNDTKTKYILYFLCFFVISFLVELCMTPKYSSIFFFKTLWRIIPSIYMLSFYNIFLLLTLLLFFIFIILHIRNFIFIIILNVFCAAQLVLNGYIPILQSKKAHKLMKQVSENNLLTKDYKNVLFSPSQAVIKNNGLVYLLNKDLLENKKIYRNIKILKPTLTSNYGKESLHNLLSKNPNKRYATFKGKQDGDEWIQIATKDKNEILGIELDTGNFKTDFPNTIEVKDCSNNLIKAQKNLGNITYTAKGLPYYAGQNKMTILFDKAINANCLKIFQTGKNKHYEWSLTQIKYLLPKMARK